MKIGTNMFSLIPQRFMNQTSRALETSLERLSSGKRINSAKDDAVGLSMSQGLDAELRGAGVAIRNANDGMSMLSVADGAMNEMTNILQSMRELAVQAANGTLSSSERSAINTQVSGLIEEFDRIASQTDFNGMKLLDGTFGTKTLQVGAASDSAISIAIADVRKEKALEKTVGRGTFQSTVTYAAGTSTTAVDLADLNKDGFLDIVTVSNNDNAVNVLLGKSDGTFMPKVSYYGGASARSVELADFNGDGILDVAAAAANDGTVNVLIGNGDGTFKPRVSYSTGTAGSSLTANHTVTAGDINGDGKVDLLVAQPNDNAVAVFLGNGDGSFKAKVTYTAPSAYAVAFGDMNGDGKQDLIVAGAGDGVADILLGNGDGTFLARTSTAAGTLVRDVRVADMNRDGILDVITISQTDAKVNILTGTGTGALNAKVSYDAGASAYAVDLADINGDGILDVVTASFTDTSVNVLTGVGDGTLNAKTSYTLGGSATAVAFGDINRDGVADIVATEKTNGTANVLLANSHSVTGVADMNLTTQTAAANALKIIDTALSKLTNSRSTIGSAQNRLQSTVDGLYISRENLSRAYSEIVDADIASETAELVRQQIMQQAGIAMLAQGNVMQANVLGLLRM